MEQLRPLNNAIRKIVGGTNDAALSKRMEHFYQIPGSTLKTGELSMSPAWHAIGHNKLSCSPILKEKKGIEFLENAKDSLSLFGSALWLLHPELARRGCTIMDSIRQGTLDEDCIQKIPDSRCNWPTPCTAMSIISNKRSAPHRDNKGIPQFFDILITLGHYDNGVFNIPTLGLHFEYNPRTMVALCGKVLIHEVNEVNNQRICFAQYFHERVIDDISKKSMFKDQTFRQWMTIQDYKQLCSRGSSGNYETPFQDSEDTPCTEIKKGPEANEEIADEDWDMENA